MARLPRYFIPGCPQHIILRGNNRQAIFAADADLQFWRDCVVEAAGRFGLAVHAYVWMTNHVHLLASPTDAHSLPKTLQSAARRYVQYFNFTYGRTGTLFEGRYRATVVDSERYLLTCMRYIEDNPVRAAMVVRAADYPWSSHRANAAGARGENADWLMPHEVYERLGTSPQARQNAYSALWKSALDETALTLIRANTHKGSALGDARFAQEVEVLSLRRAASLGRGRPRKAFDEDERDNRV
jgi:putative transposase